MCYGYLNKTKVPSALDIAGIVSHALKTEVDEITNIFNSYKLQLY